ncbi:MAG TPA: membrane dipeptidase [Pyrinomonadaceae bacterium]
MADLKLKAPRLVMGRRQFTIALAGISCLPHLGPRNATAAQGGVTPDQARDVYRRSVIIDCNTAPALGETVRLSPGALEDAARSGMTAIRVSVAGAAPSFEYAVGEIAYFIGVAEAHPKHFILVHRHSDIDRAKREAKLGLILGFEGTTMLGSDLSRLEVFQRLGVRAMQITYNSRSLFGDGCLEPGNAGLSNLGRDAVIQMNALGVAVDLSHCGARTTSEAIAASTKPVLISHGGCSAIYRHPRNKDDRELKAMADRGGVIGIFLLPFLGGEPGSPPTEGILLRHVEHALNVCGADHVGIGSDIGISPVSDTLEYRKMIENVAATRKRLGVGAPDEDRPAYVPELNHPRRLEGIAVALSKRGHTSSVIEKVIGGNFYRVLRDIWGSA